MKGFFGYYKFLTGEVFSFRLRYVAEPIAELVLVNTR